MTTDSNSNYQILIPAAGCSRRLARLTRERPKALLEVGGQSIIARSLDILNARGLVRLTLVVGYKGHLFREALGERYKDIVIEYVVAEDFDTTEHGWSLFLTRQSWLQYRAPVVFMDADNLYDPVMLDVLLNHSHDNVIMVDPRISTTQREEELVAGVDGRITGLSRGRRDDIQHCVGGFVGMNKFSAAFMSALYDYMVGFYKRHHRCYKYERILDGFIRQDVFEVQYRDCGELAWININHEDELRIAERIASQHKGTDIVGNQ